GGPTITRPRRMTLTRGTPPGRPKSDGMGTTWSLSVLHPEGTAGRSDSQTVTGPWTGCYGRGCSRCGQTTGAGTRVRCASSPDDFGAAERPGVAPHCAAHAGHPARGRLSSTSPQCLETTP